MSSLSIAHYFPFPRVKVVRQTVHDNAQSAMVYVEPDRRYRPLCHACQRPAATVHSDGHRRILRDLNLASAESWLQVRYRRVWCDHCQGARVEHLEFCQAGRRITDRLARYAHQLCKDLPVKVVAEHLGLDIKTVRKADRAFLEAQFGQVDYRDLQYLAVDEIALWKNRHGAGRYLTVVLDYLTGRIVWMGEGHRTETLNEFFEGMAPLQRLLIEAVAMDMWPPFIKSVQDYCPYAAIVFDFFHVVQSYGEVIDSVRRSEYRRAIEQRPILKGSRYLLLKNADRLTENQQARLTELLEVNAKLNAVYVLRDQLKEIYRYGDRERAKRALEGWCRMAGEVDHPRMTRFIKMLRMHEYGILNHCEYPISTSVLEGINSQLKRIKRNAHGFHDPEYFTLKAKQAFPGRQRTTFIG